MALTEAERAKRFKLYKNGDQKFYGKDFVLNKRRIRTWDAFLQTVTLDLKTNEAVRSIRTPTHGSLVKSLEDLEDNRQYVAVGNGRFKRMGLVYFLTVNNCLLVCTLVMNMAIFFVISLNAFTTQSYLIFLK